MLSMPLIPDVKHIRAPKCLACRLLRRLLAVVRLLALVTTLTARWSLDKLAPIGVKACG